MCLSVHAVGVLVDCLSQHHTHTHTHTHTHFQNLARKCEFPASRMPGEIMSPKCHVGNGTAMSSAWNRALFWAWPSCLKFGFDPLTLTWIHQRKPLQGFSLPLSRPSEEPVRPGRFSHEGILLILPLMIFFEFISGEFKEKASCPASPLEPQWRCGAKLTSNRDAALGALIVILTIRNLLWMRHGLKLDVWIQSWLAVGWGGLHFDLGKNASDV